MGPEQQLGSMDGECIAGDRPGHRPSSGNVGPGTGDRRPASKVGLIIL